MYSKRGSDPMVFTLVLHEIIIEKSEFMYSSEKAHKRDEFLCKMKNEE